MASSAAVYVAVVVVTFCSWTCSAISRFGWNDEGPQMGWDVANNHVWSGAVDYADVAPSGGEEFLQKRKFFVPGDNRFNVIGHKWKKRIPGELRK